MVLKEFWGDLAKAQVVELEVLKALQSATNNYSFEWVGDKKECFYKGDIRATDASGREIYIDVKNDSRIADTRNVLCEEEVYYKDSDYYGKGNMSCLYDVLAIVS